MGETGIPSSTVLICPPCMQPPGNPSKERCLNLSHACSSGKAAMVGIGLKETTSRYAAAKGYVWLGPKAYTAVKKNSVAKGDVLATAKMAGEHLQLLTCTCLFGRQQ